MLTSQSAELTEISDLCMVRGLCCIHSFVRNWLCNTVDQAATL